MLAPALTRVFPVPWAHRCVVVPDLHAFSTTSVLGLLLPDAVSRHRPLIWMVPPEPRTQFCSASFWQSEIPTGAPAVALSAASSTHSGVPVFDPPSSLNIPEGIGPPGYSEVVAASGNSAFSP